MSDFISTNDIQEIFTRRVLYDSSFYISSLL